MFVILLVLALNGFLTIFVPFRFFDRWLFLRFIRLFGHENGYQCQCQDYYCG